MKKNAKLSTVVPQGRGEVRIISGRWRGRKLPVLTTQGLRPTGDRVKETLFNWLQPYLLGSYCLDAFAGSGSLGFEALSRQAARVDFVERDRQVGTQLQRNLQILGCTAEQAAVHIQNSLDFLKQPPNRPHVADQFDIVFLDPPFRFGLAEQAVQLLNEHQRLTDNALIYVETERDHALNVPTAWTLLKEKTTGQVCYRLYQKEG